MKAADRLDTIRADVERRAWRVADAIAAIPGSGGALIVATATVAVVGVKTYLAFVPDTPQPGQQTTVTLDELLAEIQAHGVERVTGSVPEIAVASLVIYGAAKWYDAGQPIPDVVEHAVNRGAEWPHWWLAIPIGAAPEVAVIVPTYAYALWRYAHGATRAQVESELATAIESVLLPVVKSSPRVALLVFTLGFFGWLAWSYLLTPVAIYLDVKHVERHTYARFSWRHIVRVALVSRTFAVIRYLRRRRRAVGGWYVDDVDVDASTHRAAEGVTA
jgi:hypothetical protein